MFIAVVRKRQHNLDQPTTNTQMITEKYRKNAPEYVSLTKR